MMVSVQPGQLIGQGLKCQYVGGSNGIHRTFAGNGHMTIIMQQAAATDEK